MKIYKGPRTISKWTKTDSKSIKTWAKTWRPGKTLVFDGTIAKYGERHTDIGVEIEASDIEALIGGLVSHHKNEHARLTKETEALRTRVEQLEDVLWKIYSLVTFHARKAPDPDRLLETVGTIADHFRWEENKRPPRLGWIAWKRL